MSEEICNIFIREQYDNYLYSLFRYFFFFILLVVTYYIRCIFFDSLGVLFPL